jgi:uncharacterized membrane protein
MAERMRAGTPAGERELERAREREVAEERAAHAAAAHGWSDERVEMVVGNLLRFGVLTAGAVTALGGVFLLAQHGLVPADYHVFRGEAPELTSIGGIFRGALRLDSRAVVQLGLLLLIATPIARVCFSLVAFILQRDRLYVVITAVVLAVLLFSLLFGGHA